MFKRIFMAFFVILVLIVIPFFTLFVYVGISIPISALFAVLAGILVAYVAAILNY
jgi:hypothetical protein